MSDELESEQQLSHDEIASILESFAEELRKDGPVTLAIANEEVSIDPSDPCEFEVELESEEGERSIEFELEWEEGDSSGIL